MEPTSKKARLDYGCDICSQRFAHKPNLYRHKKSTHRSGKLRCKNCNTTFTRRDNYLRHKKKHVQVGGANPDTQTMDIPQETCLKEEALNGTMTIFDIPAKTKAMFDPMTFLKYHYNDVKKRLEQSLLRGGIKWYLSLQVRFSRRRGDAVDKAEPHFRGKCHVTLKTEDLGEGMRESFKKIYTSFIEYQRHGSNWTLEKVLGIKIHVARYRPLRGSSYIPLPIKLRSKLAVVNVQNRDNKCFLWSVLAALHPAKKNAQRTSKYKDHVTELDLTGISFPVKMVDIPRFESQNRVSINVFGFEKGDVFPMHVTKQRHDKHVNLLLISDNKKSHYCWIKNVDRLLSDQHTCKNQYFHCMYCLQGFTKERILNDHISYCQSHGVQKVQIPKEEDKWLFYKDIQKQLKVPYVIYADFECLQVPINGCQRDPTKSFTEKTTEHVPSGFAYKVVGLTHEHSKEPVVYRGSDSASKFVECMMEEQDDIERKLKQYEPMRMTGTDWQNFRTSTHCHICNKELGGDRVRDHCHVTGNFRGAAHNVCNINYKFTGRIPVVLHNLRGYDSHLIMRAIGKTHKEIKCIPNNIEKYISFSMGCMDFIDSFQFMNSSLEKLVGNLATEGSAKFEHMAQHFGEERIGLLLRKQVYPYDYFDSEVKFTETRLPPMTAFYSTLSGHDISEDDYTHAQNVWNEFQVTNLGEYHDIYVLTDVLALADVFENFRNICLNYYQLDPAHFYTSPGLAWQAALKMTGAQLELLTDIDMHLFIEKGLRGGISMISQRFAKANNKYVPNYDRNEPDSHIMYLDANNLYGWAMSQSLPVEGFRWLEEPIDVTQVPDDSDEGYILEVDLDYPSELHDLHNEYPLAPEKLQVTEDMLSPYAKNLLEEMDLKGTSSEKLIPNLQPKERYVVHYRNLKLYLSLGMKLVKVHRIMAFQQRPWLENYIRFNTEKRKSSRNDFEKDFFKLMNNAVFGKTMENLRKRVDIKLVNNQKKARKLTCKPTFHAFRIFNDDLVAIHMLKQKLYLNRPIYVGFSILDISKVLMYDFHYSYMKEKYGQRANLLFTDTDSLCYHVMTEDIYRDMYEDRHLFDTSEYEPTHPLYDTENKKALGKMKDETSGRPIHEFVGLKSKMYSLIFTEGEKMTEKKTAKGIKKNVIKQRTSHEDYKTCLLHRETHMASMTQIRSYNHQLYNVSMNKLGLSPFDDKRYLLDDGIMSFAYGHWWIPE